MVAPNTTVNYRNKMLTETAQLTTTDSGGTTSKTLTLPPSKSAQLQHNGAMHFTSNNNEITLHRTVGYRQKFMNFLANLFGSCLSGWKLHSVTILIKQQSSSSSSSGRGPARRGPERRGPERRGPERRGPERRGPERRGPGGRRPSERGGRASRRRQLSATAAATAAAAAATAAKAPASQLNQAVNLKEYGWDTAKDSKGKAYYYHSVTQVTTYIDPSKLEAGEKKRVIAEICNEYFLHPDLINELKNPSSLDWAALKETKDLYVGARKSTKNLNDEEIQLWTNLNRLVFNMGTQAGEEVASPDRHDICMYVVDTEKSITQAPLPRGWELSKVSSTDAVKVYQLTDKNVSRITTKTHPLLLKGPEFDNVEKLIDDAATNRVKLVVKDDIESIMGLLDELGECNPDYKQKLSRVQDRFKTGCRDDLKLRLIMKVIHPDHVSKIKLSEYQRKVLEKLTLKMNEK